MIKWQDIKCECETPEKAHGKEKPNTEKLRN